MRRDDTNRYDLVYREEREGLPVGHEEDREFHWRPMVDSRLPRTKNMHPSTSRGQ